MRNIHDDLVEIAPLPVWIWLWAVLTEDLGAARAEATDRMREAGA